MQQQLTECLERIKLLESRLDAANRNIQQLQADLYGDGRPQTPDSGEIEVKEEEEQEVEAERKTRSKSRSRSRSRKRSHRRDDDRHRNYHHHRRRSSVEQGEVRRGGNNGVRDEGRSVYIRWTDAKLEPKCEKNTPEWEAACEVISERFKPYARTDELQRIYLWPSHTGRMIGRVSFRHPRDFGNALDASNELREKYGYICSNML